MRNTVLIMIILVFWAGCKSNNMRKNDNKDETASLIMLSNSHVEVGILPEAGGRIVLLRQPGKKNVLKSDPALWDSAKQEHPNVSVNSKFIPYNGHIVWLGPQSEWWIHQDVAPERKSDRAPWPPDPYLVSGNYTVEEDQDKVIMTSPDSEVSGVRLTKEVSLESEGTVCFEVTGKNIRDSVIGWDLWLNTRLPGTTKCYVPVKDGGIMRIDGEETHEKDTMLYSIEKGFFTFFPEKPSEGKNNRIAKAFIYPAKNFMVAFNNQQALIIYFSLHPKEVIHKEQALVEIYNQVGTSPTDHLLELEYHAPYEKLMPGQEMKTSETWKLLEYNGNDNPEEHIAFIKNNILK